MTAIKDLLLLHHTADYMMLANWVYFDSLDVLSLCGKWKYVKKRLVSSRGLGAEEYRKVKKRAEKALEKAKKNCICTRCEEIDTCQNKSNSKRIYQVVKFLTIEKQDRFMLTTSLGID